MLSQAGRHPARRPATWGFVLSLRPRGRGQSRERSARGTRDGHQPGRACRRTGPGGSLAHPGSAAAGSVSSHTR